MTVAQPDRALKRARAGDSSMSLALVECFAVNERMNQIVLDNLDPAAWKARLPGTRSRTIAAVFTHVHNVRRKWIRLSAPASRTTGGPRPLEVYAGRGARCARAKRRPLCPDDLRSSCRKIESGRRLCARWVGKTMDAGRGDGGLHGHARGAPSGAGLHARPSARVSLGRRRRQRDVGLGKVMEGVRIQRRRADPKGMNLRQR